VRFGGGSSPAAIAANTHVSVGRRSRYVSEPGAKVARYCGTFTGVSAMSAEPALVVLVKPIPSGTSSPLTT
jgi:hypothetical protein